MNHDDSNGLPTKRTFEGVLHRWGPGQLWAIYTEDGDPDGWVRAVNESEAREKAAYIGADGDFSVQEWDEDDPERAEYAAGDVAFLLDRMARQATAHAEDVVRLTAERDHFRDAWATAQVRLDCGADATEAVRKERAAVVAYLDSDAPIRVWNEAIGGTILGVAADCIRRGEHRRKEGE